jgi:uncharacterized membrane protein YfcA
VDAAALVAVGVAVGILIGVTGSSGVALTVPALSYMGYTYQQSVGASLLVDLIASASALLIYIRAGDVDWRYALVLGAGAAAGAQLGSHLAVRSPERPLEILFAASSLYFAYTSIRNSASNIDRGLLPPVRRFFASIGPRARRTVIALSSIAIGVMSGLVGASGGIMFAVAISSMSDMPIRKVVGTAMAAMALSALSGALAYIYLGVTDVVAAIVVGISALLGGYVAARLAHRVSQRHIYTALAVLFVAVAVLELAKAIS